MLMHALLRKCRLGLIKGSAVAVAASLGLVACSRPPAPEEPVRAVRTLIVGDPGSGAGLEFAGEVRARVESRVGFLVSGRLVRRAVELGQAIKAGQTLAEIDPRDLKLEQGAARAGVVAAQTQFDQASRDFRRLQELRAQGFISAAQLERQEASVKAAQASLQQAQAQAGVQGNQAGYAVLKAPASGVVTSVDAEPGQVVSAGAPVLTLAHDGPRDVVFSIPEDRLPLIRALLRKPAGLKVRRWGEAAWMPATVREIAAAADPVTRTFLVKADLGPSDVHLGQTTTVMIEQGERGGSVRVPLSALVGRDKQSFVWVLDPKAMTVAQVPVVVGTVVADSAVIASGLRAGQEVVTAGVHVLRPGQAVRRWSPSGPPAASAAAQVSSGVASAANGKTP